jgi:hypothetical protein
MDTHVHEKGEDRSGADQVQVEAEVEDRPEPVVFAVPGGPRFVEAVRDELGVGRDMELFERDHDEPLTGLPKRRKTIRVVGHRCRQAVVEVRYEHRTKTERFPPSATVFKVLKWAVSKRGFDLDPMAAAKANLILPGAEAPLPREDVIGKYVKPGHCALVVDLTLRDFTNG